MANFVFVFVSCALFVAVVSGASEVQLISSNQKSSNLSEKEIEDFTDSEYIPVGNKENITEDLDESSAKISTLSPLQSTPSNEENIPVSISEREFENTISEHSSSISAESSVFSEKTLSSSVDTSITTKVTIEFSSTPNEKQPLTTENSNTSSSISNEISTPISTDTSTSSDDASSTLGVSTSSDDANSTPNISTSSNNISSTIDTSMSSVDVSSSNVPNNKSDLSTVSSTSSSPTSGITSSSKTSIMETDLSNSDYISDVTSPVSKDVSTITSIPTDVTSSTVIWGKSTVSTDELISNTEATITSSEDITTTTLSDKPKPNTDKFTTVTEVTLLHSSPITTEVKTTSTVHDSTTEHIKHIALPGLKKIKLGLAITFLTVAVIAMAAIIIYMIKMRKSSIPYEELSLVP